MNLIYVCTKSRKSRKQRQKESAVRKVQQAAKTEYLEMIKGRSIPNSNRYIDPARDPYRYPSVGDGVGNAVAKPIQTYTGTEMIGLGQLHKSNCVPVFKQQDAEDLAKMRR